MGLYETALLAVAALNGGSFHYVNPASGVYVRFDAYRQGITRFTWPMDCYRLDTHYLREDRRTTEYRPIGEIKWR